MRYKISEKRQAYYSGDMTFAFMLRDLNSSSLLFVEQDDFDTLGVGDEIEILISKVSDGK